MRILLDECVDRRLVALIIGHKVTTVPRHGWAGKKNGELLRLAAAEFDVFITVDNNLPDQQNLQLYDLAVAVLVAPTNRLADLQPLVPQLLDQLPKLLPCTMTIITNA
ncbi:MAG: hypothetical protein GXP24_00715 [Planctomycetes bacterium]|nr:hypothetical protein [Planctomycetota bacterium]